MARAPHPVRPGAGGRISGFVALVLKDVAEGHGFFVAGGADPGRGAERLSERFFGTNQ